MKAVMKIAAATSLALISASALAQHYTQVNLVANTAGIAPVTDPHLVNPWGLSRASGSPWWISDNGTGLSTLYNGAGAITPLVVTIPQSNPNNKTFPTGTPTGTIANGSPTDFVLAPNAPALFLFSTIDGTISGWNPAVGIAPGGAPPSTHATIEVKTTDGSSYTGLTAAQINGKTYLYAANFTKGRVDVWDNAFHKVTLAPDNGRDNDHGENGRGDNDRNDRYNNSDNDRPFTDNHLPRNFVPFNVQTIGNDIVVTFVLHQEGNPFETDGAGLGYVDIFSSTGKLLQRLEHGDWLNAPWGVALAPLDFGAFSHALLIGQFAGGSISGSGGTIAAYDLATGDFLGLVKDSSNKTLAIAGLWALSPGNSATPSSYDPAAAPAGELYFTAGPDHGTGGLFGYLKPVAAELTQGNDQ
ncbi:MAG TPA: TIGR03118 family protein [Acidobacteriaceae bacterium]|nr:TIGR03118 family protein [Acidobacteriaceae bacterium]